MSDLDRRDFLKVIGTGAAFSIAYFIDPSRSFGVLATMVLAATFFMALFDTTADALAVDVVPPSDHSRVQAWMTGGRAAGLVVLSAVFGLIADTVGYQVIFLVIAALVFLVDPEWLSGTADLQWPEPSFRNLVAIAILALLASRPHARMRHRIGLAHASSP